jgi:SAM-dependent methyltransferase
VSTLESDYYAFMGYDGDHSRKGLVHYVQYFRSGPVLELACGRGEFLGLLREAGVEVSGVDIDEGMVTLAAGQGHQVALGDAIGYLEDQPAGSLGGLFCAHFLEHLMPDDVLRVYAGAAAALRPGGSFVAVVPSAASLSVLGYDFWRDPTHVRFYDPMLLAFFADRSGLTVTTTGGNPRNEPGPPPQTVPVDFAAEPSLGDALVGLAQRAQAVFAAAAPPGWRPDPAAGAYLRAQNDAQAKLWDQLTHLASVLDQRVQAVQHQNAELRSAYRNLLSALYPSSEVYVVATLPADAQ